MNVKGVEQVGNYQKSVPDSIDCNRTIRRTNPTYPLKAHAIWREPYLNPQGPRCSLPPS